MSVIANPDRTGGGSSIRHTQQQLRGHSDLKTIELYTHLAIEDLKTAVEKASSNLSE